MATVMTPSSDKGKLLKVREMNSDDGFVCEGYEQDGGIEMRKIILFGLNLFFGGGGLLV